MSPVPGVDQLDGEIVEILRRDGRATFEAVGAAVGLSGSATKRRVDRLERQGVIRGYSAVIDDSRLSSPVEAFAELRFAGDTDVADIAAIGRDVPEVEAVYTTAGDPDALVLIRVRDVEHLTAVINRIRRGGTVRSTKTLMVLATWRPELRTSR